MLNHPSQVSIDPEDIPSHPSAVKQTNESSIHMLIDYVKRKFSHRPSQYDYDDNDDDDGNGRWHGDSDATGRGTSGQHAPTPRFTRSRSRNPPGNESDDAATEVSLSVSQLRALREKTLKLIFQHPTDFVTFLTENVHDVSNRFKLFGMSFNLILSPLGKEAAKLGTALALLDSLLTYLLSKIKKIHTGKNPFYVSFRIIQPEILTPPICTPYLKVTEISTHAQLLSQLSMVSVSKPALLADGNMTVELSCLGIERDVREVTFGGRKLKRNQFPTDADYANCKRGVINVPNLLWENDCLLVATVLGLEMLKWNKNCKKLFDRDIFRKTSTSSKLISMAISFSNQCSPKINWNNPQNVHTCSIVQSNLNSNYNVQLIVHNSVLDYKNLFFRGQPYRNDKRQQLHLLLKNNHMFILKDHEKFFGIFNCNLCRKTFKIGTHKFCRGAGRLCLKCRTTQCYRESRRLANSDSEVHFEAQMCATCNGFFPHQFFLF